MRIISAVALTALALARTAGAQTCNLNGFGADELVLTVPAAGSDFDLGWKGKYHDLHVPGGAQFDLCLANCDTTTDPVCDVAGYAGGQSAAGRAFAPPIPIAIGSIATCVVTTFKEPFATGTANLETGAIEVVANVSGDVYLTSFSNVCPVCTGTNAGDAGTCSGGADNGAACTTDEVIMVQNATAGNPYRVSRDCLPAGTPISTAFSLTVTTGMARLDGLCPGQTSADDCGAGTCGTGNCTGAGNGSGLSQNCCTNDTAKRCFPDPLIRTGSAATPSLAWPDPSYPKTSSETIVSTLCAPAAPGGLGAIVNGDVGLAGPAAFILPVTADWILDETPTTTTSSTTTSTSTTTTTAAPECLTAADCDDANACTDDACNGGICGHAQVGGAAGVVCDLGGVLDQPACEPLDPTLRSKLDVLVAKARTALQSVASASPKKAKKLRKRADGALKVAVKRIGKAARKGTITGPCKDALGAAIAAIRAEIAGLG